ncbi:MAG: hypothetical protein PHR36_02845 [Patescibacteria group bacterium]|nr:hypothetical protein [Patescibacteria group bacterium]
MLTPKKLGKNKLIMYISAIAIMLIGIGFFIYKSYSPALPEEMIIAEETPAEMEEQGDYSPDVLSEEEPGVQEKKEVSLEIKEAEIEKELLNLDLLAKAKFKKLEENKIEEEDFMVGKRNPFVPD